MRNFFRAFLWAMGFALAILLGASAWAQSGQSFGQKDYYASDYGTWQFKNQYANTYTFQPGNVCDQPQPNTSQKFFPFSTNAPIWIRDAVQANSEVLTPHTVISNEAACGVVISPIYSHYSFTMQSATGGLQEVLNAISGSIPYAVQVILDRNWYASIGAVPGASATQVIATVQGNSAAYLVDQTQSPYVFYVWNTVQSKYVAVSASGGGIPASGGTFTGAINAPAINGEVYPVACSWGANAPSWCSGTTADAWIRAACTQLPAAGGTLNLLGLTGTIAAQVPCSTPTKLVHIKYDNVLPLNITEADGQIAFPQDAGSDMTGPAVGQSLTSGGIHLTSGANVTAVVGPAHVDGTQESFTAKGLAILGATGATVTKGLIYAYKNYANTTISNNTLLECNNACIWAENLGGQIQIWNNWANLTAGNYSITGSAIVLKGSGTNGCAIGPVNLKGNTIEHANGGGPELLITGDGAGALACGVTAEDSYLERNGQSTPSTVLAQVTDCWGCNLTNLTFGGGNGTAVGDDINISQTALGRTYNVHLTNDGGPYRPAINTVNDTTPNGQVFPANVYLAVDAYTAQPGAQQLPPLPQNTLQSLGSDQMGGQGSFSTGSGTLGTNFQAYGCVPAAGVTCTYTRTSSTAPPGYTFSQQIAVTANTDSSIGLNGVQYASAVSYFAGVTYQFSFWGKDDGSFTGLPAFILGDSTVPTQICSFTDPQSFTATWTLYSGTCTPNTSGTSFLSFSAVTTPVGATGTFWLGGLSFAPVQPGTIGAIATWVAPYGFGAATDAQKTATVNGIPCEIGGTCTISSSGTINTGTAFSPLYYTATGTTVGGVTPFNGLAWFSSSAAPSAATSSQVQGVIGSGVYDTSGAAAGATATAAQKANNLSDLASPATARVNLGVLPVASPTATGTLTAPTIVDSGLTAGTAPICPNGTGGAFTTTGCSSGGSTTTNALTLNNSGSGATAGTSFNGSTPVTLSYNTIGAAPANNPTLGGTVTLSAQTGSTQCLQVSTGGVVSGTGAGCATGVTISGVNTQSGTSYTVLSSDSGKLVNFTSTSNVAVALAAASAGGFGSGNTFFFKNSGSAWVTITPASGTIDGFTTLTLAPYETAMVTSTGANYLVIDRSPFWSTPAPTLSVNAVTAGAGTGATGVLAAGSTNSSGQIQLTAGSGSSGSNLTLLTMTFANGGFKKAPYCSLTAASLVSATANLFLNGGGSLTNLQVLSPGALVSGGLYYLNYSCPE